MSEPIEYLDTSKKSNIMEKYLEPTKDLIIMGFVASCIESVADRMNVGYQSALINVYLLCRKALLEEAHSLIFDSYKDLSSDSGLSMRQCST